MTMECLDFFPFRSEILLSVSVLVIFLYWQYTTNFSYWSKRNVSTARPVPILGNIADVFFMRRGLTQIYSQLYTRFKEKRFCGVYVMKEPILLLTHPDLIKDVLIDRFDVFHSRGIPSDEADILSCHLITMNGDMWKWMRNICNPFFQLDKSDEMFKNVQKCSVRLNEALERIMLKFKPRKVLDFKEACSRFCTDAAGLYYCSLNMASLKEYDSEVRRISNLMFGNTTIVKIKQSLYFLFPKLVHLIRIAEERESEQYFVGIVKELILHRLRKKLLKDDLLQSLINIKYKNVKSCTSSDSKQSTCDDVAKKDKTEEKFNDISDGLIAAQCYMFILGGAELSSIPMSFCLYELALNLEIQERLRREIDVVLERNYKNLTYEAIRNMKYLHQVYCETLRKYPSLGITMRECSKNYVIPKENVVLEKGTRVVVPIYAIHHDPEYYPHPEKFDPERFSEGNDTRPPYTFLPFGEGPRKCIGMEFAAMQFKVGIFYLLSEYKFTLPDKTSVPLKIDTNMIFTVARGGVKLDINPR